MAIQHRFRFLSKLKNNQLFSLSDVMEWGKEAVVSEHEQSKKTLDAQWRATYTTMTIKRALFFLVTMKKGTIRIRWWSLWRRCWSAACAGWRTETEAAFEGFESIHVASATTVDERHASAPLGIVMPSIVTVTARTSVHWQTTHNCTHDDDDRRSQRKQWWHCNKIGLK